MKIPLPDSDISIDQDHFDSEIAGNLLRELAEEIPWVQNKIKFYGKESLVPRLESWHGDEGMSYTCLLYTSPSPRDGLLSRMPSSA